MEAGYISATLQRLWGIWNIRGFMMMSLTVQLLLAFTAPLRQKTSNFVIISLVWSAYFLADWTAIFAFGLIANAGCTKSPTNVVVSNDLLALWASFLLIHLGGPDNITAFSLEDNALWLRHLVGLIAQVFAFFYIFAKTLPDNKLMAATVLVFATGIIQYGERTRALYLASLENLKESSIKLPQQEDVESSIKRGFHFFEMFKGLIVDIMPNHSQWLESREFFLKQEADFAFRTMERELNLLYEVFYTKIMAANSTWGMSIRYIAFYLSVAAFVVFCINKKEEIHSTDIWITYALFVGVMTLDTLGEIMLTGSYWRSNESDSLRWHIIGRCFVSFFISITLYYMVILPLYMCGCEDFLDRLWSQKMGCFNLLVYSFEEGRPRRGCMLRRCCGAAIDFITEKIGMAEVIAKFRYTSKVDMENDMWSSMFNTLKGRASDANDPDKVREVHAARGELVLQDSAAELKLFVTGFEYHDSVILWHIATEICCHIDPVMDKNNENVRFSKTFSDYMIYLLVKQPDMMSAVAGIFHKRYRDTCGELKRFEKRVEVETLGEFCSKVVEEYNHGPMAGENRDRDAGSTMLIDSCSLVSTLMTTERKWELIRRVWMELLAYSAGHCRVDSHARMLNQGGEFLTFVWLLMSHLGVGPHFPLY